LANRQYIIGESAYGCSGKAIRVRLVPPTASRLEDEIRKHVADVNRHVKPQKFNDLSELIIFVQQKIFLVPLNFTPENNLQPWHGPSADDTKSHSFCQVFRNKKFIRTPIQGLFPATAESHIYTPPTSRADYLIDLIILLTIRVLFSCSSSVPVRMNLRLHPSPLPAPASTIEDALEQCSASDA
jgi:hypothetical protein